MSHDRHWENWFGVDTVLGGWCGFECCCCCDFVTGVVVVVAIVVVVLLLCL